MDDPLRKETKSKSVSVSQKPSEVKHAWADGPKVAVQRLEDADDSESEVSEEEDVSDEESSEEVDDFDCLCLHRFHFSTSSGSSPGPVSFDCESAQQLADRAVFDLKARGDMAGCRKVYTVIKKSEMEITGGGVSCKVRVQRAEVAIAELEEAIFVVTLVPEGAKGAEWCSRTERAQRAAKGVEGWIFTCGSDRLHDFLTKISYAGGIRSGLTNHYHMFAQGKQGLGAFSFVACAAEMKTDRIVAIKNLKLQVNPITIFKEVDMLRAGQGHPNIVRFHGLWADSTPSEQSKGGKQWYMVMDYFKCDLYDRIVEGRRLREKECIPILHNVLAAIAFLHQRQIFHRDIKPENLLVDTSARVVLTDFGIACLVTEQEELKRVVGTVGYAAPEMLAGTATSFEADEFGAGIVLYFMLSKSTPFLAPTTAKTIEKTMEGKVNLRYGCFDHISEHCRTMIYGLICKDVAARIKAHEALRTAYMMSRASMTEPVLDSIPQVQPKKPQGNLPNVMEVSEPSDKLGCATQGHLPFLRKK